MSRGVRLQYTSELTGEFVIVPTHIRSLRGPSFEQGAYSLCGDWFSEVDSADYSSLFVEGGRRPTCRSCIVAREDPADLPYLLACYGEPPAPLIHRRRVGVWRGLLSTSCKLFSFEGNRALEGFSVHFVRAGEVVTCLECLSK